MYLVEEVSDKVMVVVVSCNRDIHMTMEAEGKNAKVQTSLEDAVSLKGAVSCWFVMKRLLEDLR